MKNLKSQLQNNQNVKILTEEKNEFTLEIENNYIINIANLLLGKNYLSLLTIVAVDLEEKIKLIYRLADIENNRFINLQTFVKNGEHIESLSDLFKSANWLEREVYDLFGVKFLNHPNLTRILNPDDFKGFPLLKNAKKSLKKSKNPNQLTFF